MTEQPLPKPFPSDPLEGEPFANERFQYVALRLRNHAPYALLRVVRSLFEEIVAEGRNVPLFIHPHESKSVTCLSEVWPFLERGFTRNRALSIPVAPEPIDLAETPVRCSPWETDRLIRALSEHGEGRARGAWRQDDNHYVWTFHPGPLAILSNGNHSGAMGTLLRQGTITPQEAFDISDVYRRFATDGTSYWEVAQPSNSHPVDDLRWAAIFYALRTFVLSEDARLGTSS